MNLRELKNKIDFLITEYDENTDIMIGINFDPYIDDTIRVTRGKISTQNIIDITKNTDKNIICISNYKMEE